MNRVARPTDGTSAVDARPSPEQVRAREIAAGYTALGDFFVAHPHLVRHLYRGVQTTQSIGLYGNNAREVIGEFVAAARPTHGVTVEEYYMRPYGGVRLTFAGAVQFRVYAMQQCLGASRTARTAKYPPLLADLPMSAEEWGDNEADHDRVPTTEGYAEYLAGRAGGAE